jgi:hypothetical protein
VSRRQNGKLGKSANGMQRFSSATSDDSHKLRRSLRPDAVQSVA